MITIMQWMKAINYLVCDNSKYCWNCYGDNATTLSSWTFASGYHAGLVFDTVTYEIYEASVCDYKNRVAYKLINPKYVASHAGEIEQRNLDCNNTLDHNEAWDGVNFSYVDIEEDFLEKLNAIITGIAYDPRIQVPIDIDKDMLYDLMFAAHKKDITLNQHMENILMEKVK